MDRLDKEFLKESQENGKIISMEEALKDVIPINWSATPSLKGFEAVKLIKSVMTSEIDFEKVKKLDRLSRRIDSYKSKRMEL